MQTIAIFEQTELTRKQLEDSNIVKKVENLRIRTSNQYLAYRLELLLGKWHTFLQKDLRMAQSQQIKSNSVFEAIIQNDEEFFETDNIYELMRRLDKSFGTNGKVWRYFLPTMISLFETSITTFVFCSRFSGVRHGDCFKYDCNFARHPHSRQ